MSPIKDKNILHLRMAADVAPGASGRCSSAGSLISLVNNYHPFIIFTVHLE